MREKNVNYELVVEDDLPGGEQPLPYSPLEDQLVEVMAKQDLWAPKWVRIGKYQNQAAASAAANLLRKRHGDVEAVEGWRFECRRIDGGENTGLFVQYDPNVIIPGKKEENRAKYQEWKKRQAEAKKVRAEQKMRELAEADARAEHERDIARAAAQAKRAQQQAGQTH